MMATSSCDGSVMQHSWKDLVKVNGSFYCNLSSAENELEPPSPPPSPPSSPPPSPPLTQTFSAAELATFHHHHTNWMTKNEPIYVNSHSNVHLSNGSNRTILRIGDQIIRQPSPVDVESSDFSTSSGASCHTIKLVIGEPLSLDTSEYVSWDGSQTEAQSAASADDDDDEEEDEEEEDSGSDQVHLPDDCRPLLPPTSPLRPHSAVDDELTHSCCRFFDQRQQKLSSSFVSTTWNPAITPEAATLDAAESAVKSPVHPGLNAKMEHLRMEIVSLVNQDDALFRQLLALNTSIHQLRSQSLQRRARTLSSNRSRSQLSPTLSASLASLTSLTSLSDGEDAEVEGDDSDPDPKNVIIGAGQSVTQRQTISTVVGQAASNNNKPVAPQQQTQLTRKRVSYPPKSRNRSNSQLSRCSFNSSSSSSSSSSTSSSSGGSPTWSLSSADAKAIVKGVKTPRSPHSSFYSRSPTKNPQLSTNNKQRSSANNKHADLLMVFHKRQGSYDSGCQGSEPSDAEVFV